MFYTDDPVRDFHNYDAEVQAKLSKLPKCDDCADIIQDDYYYSVDGDILCESCMNDRYRHCADEYLE